MKKWNMKNKKASFYTFIWKFFCGKIIKLLFWHKHVQLSEKEIMNKWKEYLENEKIFEMPTKFINFLSCENSLHKVFFYSITFESVE